MRSCQLTAYQVSFSMTNCNGKNSCLLPWAAMQAGSTFPKMGLERVLNCNTNFVKLKCTFLTSASCTEQPIGQCTWKEGNSNNTQNTRHLPVCQIHFRPFELSREKVIFPHIWDTTSWFLHQLICFFIQFACHLQAKKSLHFPKFRCHCVSTLPHYASRIRTEIIVSPEIVLRRGKGGISQISKQL